MRKKKINLWRFPMARIFRDFGLKIHSRYFFQYLAKHPEQIFQISLFFIGTTFPIPRTSGITFDVSLVDLKKNLSAIGTTLFSHWNHFLKCTLDVWNLLKISPLENAISYIMKHIYLYKLLFQNSEITVNCKFCTWKTML